MIYNRFPRFSLVCFLYISHFLLRLIFLSILDNILTNISILSTASYRLWLAVCVWLKRILWRRRRVRGSCCTCLIKTNRMRVSFSVHSNNLSSTCLEWSNYSSDVRWTVRHCDNWRMKNQLDATCYFIVPIIGSTCFGHYYAHHHELATIMLITTLVVSFLVCYRLEVRYD